MTDGTANDEVRLTIPALPVYGRLARRTAAGIALRQRLSFREVEDLRLALDEALIALLEAQTPGRVVLEFAILDPGVRVRVQLRDDAGDRVALVPEAVERFDELAAELVDRHELDADAGVITFSKRRG